MCSQSRAKGRRQETGWREGHPPQGCCCARTPSVCWGLLQKTNTPPGEGPRWCLGQGGHSGTRSTLPPACLLFVRTPEKPGARGLWPRSWGQLQYWTPLLRCGEQLLSKHASSTTGAQASSQLRKDTVPSGYLPGSGLLAGKEGKVTVFIRTQEGRASTVLHTHLEQHLSAQGTPFLGGVHTLENSYSNGPPPRGCHTYL